MIIKFKQTYMENKTGSNCFVSEQIQGTVSLIMIRIALMFASLALPISCQSKEAPEPGKVDLTISPEIIEALGYYGVENVCCTGSIG